MVDPAAQAWLDQEDSHVADTIRRHGWLVEYVFGGEGDGPPFAYTVGLFGLGHPELVIVGTDHHTAHNVLNHLGERIRSGRDLVAGELLTFEHWQHRLVVEQLPNPGDTLFSANRFYGRPSEASVPAFQLSYDDKAGRFPWDAGYAAPEMQPRPGTWNAW